MPLVTKKIILGACLTGPTRRAMSDLRRMALAATRVRNIAVDTWKEYHDRRPGILDDDSPRLSDVFPDADTLNLYAAAVAQVPELATGVVATLVRRVIGDLKSQTPWNYQGEADYVWQAILLNEQRRSYSVFNRQIPVPWTCSHVIYDGKSARPSSARLLKRYGDSCAVLATPLFRESAGRRVTMPVYRINVGALSAGDRRRIGLACDPDDKGHKILDSFLKEKDGKWYFYLSMSTPVVDHGLDPSRALVIKPEHKRSGFSFRAFPPDDDSLGIGQMTALSNEIKRLKVRRQVLRYRYRKEGLAKGKGRGKFYEKDRPIARGIRGLRSVMHNELLSDIIRQCRHHNCGRLEYYEPTMPVRDSKDIPFNRLGLEFPWSEFYKDLKSICEANTIIFASCQESKKRNRHVPRLNKDAWENLVNPAGGKHEKSD